MALKEAGVVCIIAPSFARIFFRNAINLGLPLAQADLPCRDGDLVVVDFSAGTVTLGETTTKIPPLSPKMLEILAAGGLVEHWRKRG